MKNISDYLDDDKRDKPLSFDWRAKDWQHGLTLPSAPTSQHDLIRNAILLDAFMEARGLGREISYSRNRNWYPRRKQYFPLATHGTVTWAVDSTAATGYLSTWIAPSGKAHGRQSTLHATPKLLEELPMPANLERVPGELVRLKDRDGRLEGYKATERTMRMQRELKAHNEALGSVEINLDVPGAVRNGPLLVFPVVEGRKGPAVVNTGSQGLYRVFNGAWNRGGRAYGHWVQNVPSEYRAIIRMDGSETVEPDYDELHLVLTYALAGLPAPHRAYEIAHWPRKVAKLAVLILLNALNFMSARGAIAAVLREKMDMEPQKAECEATRLIAEVKAKHGPIMNYFHSGVGLDLQNIDSNIAARVLRTLRKQGIIAVPIHDSFLAPNPHEGSVLEAMNVALFNATNGRADMEAHCREFRSQSNELTDESLTYGGGVSVVFSLPPPLQGDLFYSEALVPVHEVSSWSRGCLPPGLRAGIVYEMKRRQLRQIDIARRIGLSRPQLTNALQGRYGVGPRAAEALKAFVLEEAVRR